VSPSYRGRLLGLALGPRRPGEGQRGQRGQVADVGRLSPPRRRVLGLEAWLAQALGVVDCALQLSITTEGVLLGVGHLGVRSVGFGTLCLPLLEGRQAQP
jgi:hypothetical protein